VVTANAAAGRFAAIAFLLGALLMAGCGDSPTSPSSSVPTTFLSLTSTPGDRIGNGFKQHVGLADGVFSARVDAIHGSRVSVAIGVRPVGRSLDWWWDLRFTMPAGQALRPGTYEGVHRWPGVGEQAGMDFSGTGRGCSYLTGRFVITEVALGPDNTLDRLHITFEQQCDSATAPIRGEISIVANPWR
jgi:hypothetical protein